MEINILNFYGMRFDSKLIRLQNGLLIVFYLYFSQFHQPKYMLSTLLKCQTPQLKNKPEIMLPKMNILQLSLQNKMLLVQDNHQVMPVLLSSQ